MARRFGQVLWLLALALVALGFNTHDGNAARFMWFCAVPIALLAYIVLPPGKRPG